MLKTSFDSGRTFLKTREFISGQKEAWVIGKKFWEKVIPQRRNTLQIRRENIIFFSKNVFIPKWFGFDLRLWQKACFLWSRSVFPVQNNARVKWYRHLSTHPRSQPGRHTRSNHSLCLCWSNRLLFSIAQGLHFTIYAWLLKYEKGESKI